MNKSCVAACLESVRMAVESVSGCAWNECPDQRGITVRMCVEWVSESAWNPQLRQIIPLSETTIYEMERRGEFPRRFNLTPRCVVWDLAEVEAWIEERKQAPRRDISGPDVRLRKTRPVRAGSDQA